MDINQDAVEVERLVQAFADAKGTQAREVRVRPSGDDAEAIKVWVDLRPGHDDDACARWADACKAALSKATIRRHGSTELIPVDLRAALNGKGEALPALQRLDTLTIPENKNQIAVMGGVHRTGPYLIPEGETLSMIDAIAMAGGPLPRANLTMITHARMTNGQWVQKTVNMKGMLKGAKSSSPEQNEPLQPGDVIFVPDPTQPRQSPIGPILGFAAMLLGIRY